MIYLALALGALIILTFTLLTFRYLFYPGEKREDHIKRQILEDAEPEEGGTP